MRALVVYESAFGNTQKVAEAVAEGLSEHVPTDLEEIGDAPHEVGNDVDLLIVGGPTHAFSMSRPGTRASAAKQAEGPPVSKGDGLREWLASLRNAAPRAAAAFDTRFRKPRPMTGSAARAAERRLRKLGYRIAAPAESFFVSATTGPLLEGELDRAQAWGARLGSVAAQPAGRR
jgi:hypothetical protein